MTGRDLLSSWIPARLGDLVDYHLAEIVRVCLADKTAEGVAKLFSKNLAHAVHAHQIYAHDCDHVVAAIFEVQPVVALDAFLSTDSRPRRPRVYFEFGHGGKNPLDFVTEEMLIAWCNQDAENRYPLVAGLANIFVEDKTTNVARWTDVARRLLAHAPDRVAVLEAFVTRFHPMSWGGSLADIIERRSTLLEEFRDSAQPALRQTARRLLQELSDEAQREREWERQHNVTRDQRFE